MIENIKEIFTDYCNLTDETSELSKVIKDTLKKDEVYQGFLKNLEDLKNQIEEYKDNLIEDLSNKLKENKNQLKMIVEDLSEKESLKSNFVKKSLDIQKKIRDKNFDELDTLNSTYNKIFE